MACLLRCLLVWRFSSGIVRGEAKLHYSLIYCGTMHLRKRLKIVSTIDSR